MQDHFIRNKENISTDIEHTKTRMGSHKKYNSIFVMPKSIAVNQSFESVNRNSLVVKSSHNLTLKHKFSLDNIKKTLP